MTGGPPEPPEPPVVRGVTVPYRARFDECGPDGLVRSSALLRYAQDVAWIHSERLRFDRAWYAARDLARVVRAIELAILEPLPLGRTIALSTAVTGFRRVWARRRTDGRDEDGRLVLWGHTDWVMTDTRRGLPGRVPDEFPAAFAVPANIFEAERDRATRRLLLADEEIERLAALAERERIARDLHDLLGHTLSVIIVKSELAGRLVAADPDRAAAEIGDIERIGRQALAEVRAAVRGYRARGLEAELEGAERALAAADVDVTVERATLPPLDPEHESALALALREAVTNVIRHARAARATIAVSADASGVVLEVADDGRGTDGTEGSGLAGMRERIAALGGEVVVDGSAGTRVRVRVPAP